MIIIYGDSCVAGDGLIDPNTRVSELLSKKLGMPVVNKGVSGCGPMTIASIIDPSADTVIIAWPGLIRWQDPNGGLWGPWKFNETGPMAKRYLELVQSDEIFNINLGAILRTREALKEVNLIEYQYVFTHSYTQGKGYPIPDLELPKFKFIDYASDGVHPGPATNEKIANWLFESIKKP